MSKSATLTVRLSSDLRNRLDVAIEKMPYKPTITTVVERGLELAVAELEILTNAANSYRANVEDGRTALKAMEGGDG